MIEEEKRKLHEAVDKFTKETKDIDIEVSRIYNSVLGGNYDGLFKVIKDVQSRIEKHNIEAGKIDLKTFSTDVTAQKNEFNITGKDISNTYSLQKADLKSVQETFVRLYNIEIEALKNEIDKLLGVIRTEKPADKTDLEAGLGEIKKELPTKVAITVNYNTNIKDNLDLKKLANSQKKFKTFVDGKIKTHSNDKLKAYNFGYNSDNVASAFSALKSKFETLEQEIEDFKIDKGFTITAGDLKNKIESTASKKIPDLLFSTLNSTTRENNINQMGLQQALEFFSASVISSKNNLSEDVYKSLVKEVEEFYSKLDKMKKDVNDAINSVTITAPSVNVTIANKYKNYIKQMNDEYFNARKIRQRYVIALNDSENNKLSPADLLDLECKTRIYTENLDNLFKQIENEKNNLGDQLYNNLKAFCEDRKKRISEIKKELTNPRALSRNVSGNDLNKNLKTITEDIDKINEKMEEYKSKRIIPRKERKNIDKSISEIDDKIETLEKFLDLIEDKNSREYKEISEQLKTQKDRLKIQKKYYKKKTPKLVRFRKSAKNWFKKHKKGLLIAAGLATLAILAQPVLIPAIMHGNILMSGAVPAMKSTLMGINSTLCNLVGAKAAGGVITFSNGVMLSPTVVSNALLKGVAASGISSALLISPVIALIYDVGKKIKNKQFMQQFRNKKQQLSDLNQRRKDRKEKRAINRANKADERKLRDAAIEISKIDPTDTNAINAIYTKYDITDEDDKIRATEYAEEAKNSRGRR